MIRNIDNLPCPIDFMYSVNDEDFYYKYINFGGDERRIKLTKEEHEHLQKIKDDIEIDQMYEVCGRPETYDFFKNNK